MFKWIMSIDSIHVNVYTLRDVCVFILNPRINLLKSNKTINLNCLPFRITTRILLLGSTQA